MVVGGGKFLPPSPLRSREWQGGAGEVPWTIQGARGWGGDAPSRLYLTSKAALISCLGMGGRVEGAPTSPRSVASEPCG